MFQHKVDGIKTHASFCHGVFYIKMGFKYKNNYNETKYIEFSACYSYSGSDDPYISYNIDDILGPYNDPSSDIIGHIKKYNRYLRAFIKLIENPPKFTREEAKQYMAVSIRERK